MCLTGATRSPADQAHLDKAKPLQISKREKEFA